MGTVTSYLSLLKPDPGEKVNVLTHINQNLDKIAAGILAIKNRQDTVEAGWTNYVPEIKYGATITAHDVTVARWKKLGDQVTVQIEATTTGSAEAIALAPIIKVPYLVTSRVVGGHGVWTINISGGPGINFRPMFFMPRIDSANNQKYMHIGYGADNISTLNSDIGTSGDGPASTKARITAQFTYVTDGTLTT